MAILSNDEAGAARVGRQAAPHPITLRSVVLGMVGVAIICLVTPYNDHVLRNTFMVGNSMPLAALTLTFLLAALVNGPLSVWKPRWALSSGELGIVLAMMLVGSALPGSALMRYFPAGLIYTIGYPSTGGAPAQLLSEMGLPHWLFPSFAGETPREWAQHPVLTGFAARWTEGGMPPYTAWVKPALTWGVYLVGFHGAILCLLVIVRRQWHDNERLTFPLAQIQLALLEAPRPGRWFGGVLASRVFWIALVAINLLHGLNAMHVYQPDYFPEIPIGFNFRDMFSEPPLSYVQWPVQQSQIYFIALGVAYLLPGAVSFSLWFFVVALALLHVPVGMATGDPIIPTGDQHFGGMLAYAGIVIWIGRRHWALVLRQAFRGERENEPRGRYISYRAAFWMLIGFVGLMIGWMIAMGMTALAAVVTTAILLLGFLLLARIVAETGLIHPGNLLNFIRPWQLVTYYSGDHAIPTSSFFRSSLLYLVHNDARESFAVFGSHAIKITDQTVFHRPGGAAAQDERSTGRKLLLLFAMVLVVGFVLSLGSMLWVEYEYAYEQYDGATRIINADVADNAVRLIMYDRTAQYEAGNYNHANSPATQVGAGAITTIFLAVMRFQFMWWPFHPVGYLFMATGPMRQLWFSIFLGWLVRTITLRFGGSQGYLQVQPAMMGLIIGEAVASALWLGLGLLLSTTGMPFHPIRFTLK